MQSIKISFGGGRIARRNGYPPHRITFFKPAASYFIFTLLKIKFYFKAVKVSLYPY